MRRTTGWMLALALLTATAVSAQPKWLKDPADRQSLPFKKGQKTEGVGTVQYDPGPPPDFLAAGPTNYSFIGNLFDTRNGQPLSPGSISSLSWYQGFVPGNKPEGFTGSVYLAFFTPGANSPFTFGAVFGVDSYTTNVFTGYGSLPVPPSFIVAFAFPQSPQEGNAPFGSLGMRSASTNGQGFHAVQRSFSGANTSNISGQNGMLRVRGSIVVPVELMEFDVE